MYSQELESLKEQNLKLAESTKQIEEKYREVSEMVKSAIKPPQAVKEVQDASEKITEKSKRSKKTKRVAPEQIQPTQQPTFQGDIQDRGESTKTIPKKPPTKSSIESLKQQPQKCSLIQSHNRQTKEQQDGSQPSSTSRRERLESPQPDFESKKRRFLLPQRGKVNLKRGFIREVRKICWAKR